MYALASPSINGRATPRPVTHGVSSVSASGPLREWALSYTFEQSAFTRRRKLTSSAIWLPSHTATWQYIGSKFRCMRSALTDTTSTRLKFFRVLRKDGRKRTHKQSFQFFRLRRRLTQMALPKDLRPADPLPGFSDHEIPFRIDSPRRRINSGCAISRKRWIIRASLERLLHRMEMRRDGRTRLSFSRSRSEVPDGLSFLFYTRDI